MKIKMVATTLQQDKGFVKGEAEVTTVLKAKLRKASYTSIDDGENMRQGTGDPWGTLVVRGFDPAAFGELSGLKPGDTVVVSIEKAGKK